MSYEIRQGDALDLARAQGGQVAPFPYFGGKSSIASEVWARLGDCRNYVEPFFGSGAVLLARPAEHEWWDRIETVNDADGLLCNFWRATQAAPEEVAAYADWPVNENDLHARHAWLVAHKDSLQARLEGDPDFYDAKAAGWWVWGLCLWIGGGWCAGVGPWHVEEGRLVKSGAAGGTKRQMPHLGDAGMGIHRKRPHLGAAGGTKRQMPHLGDAGRGIHRQMPHLMSAGMGIHRKRPHLGNAGRGECELWSEHLRQMMQALCDRLRRVRVCCGDWSRVCGLTPTVKQGLTGVFLDPPYSHALRDDRCYSTETDCAQDVLQWCRKWGGDERLRIALCGYDGEHNALEDEGWTVWSWKARGGYGSQGQGRGRDNAHLERVWFSPHCLSCQPDPQVQGSLL